MTQLTIGGTVPTPTPSPTIAHQTALDERVLDGLVALRQDAERLAFEIAVVDQRRRDLDDELDRRKIKLDDPNLANHPLRPRAVEAYDALEAEATLLPFTRRRLCADLGYVIDKAVSLIRRLSPAAEEACSDIWDRAFCIGPDPWAAGWRLSGYRPEAGAWGRRTTR